MRAVVVGDVLLDRDLDGPSTRLCPDAPVPVVDIERERLRAGGAGLVARLLATEGHETTLVTALSDDWAARQLRRCLADVELVAGPSGVPTPVKTRVLKRGTPVVRFDENCGPAAVPTVTVEMLSALDEADAVVVADYGRLLLAEPRLRRAIAARSTRIPVVWDPHPRGVEPVPGMAAVTPNLAEAIALTDPTGGDASDDLDRARELAGTLRRTWRAGAVVVTLGELGAWLDGGDGSGHVPAAPLDQVDSCGAGDRFAAGLAVALADTGGSGLQAAVRRAITVTGDFLRSGGVTNLPPVSAPEAPAHLADAIELAENVRRTGGTVVATGGCFDLVHAGHLRTLRAARALGDVLIVCVNSDESVRRLKGRERPLMSQSDRRELLLALDCVDAVAVFDEDTPEQVLTRLMPDLWVKGSDYVAELLPEHDLVRQWGGRCVTVPFQPGRSTTSLAAALARIA